MLFYLLARRTLYRLLRSASPPRRNRALVGFPPMPDPPRDRSHPAPRHSTPLPPIATPSRHTPPPPHQTSTPPTPTSRRREHFPDHVSIVRTTDAPAPDSLPLSRAPTALMTRYPHNTDPAPDPRDDPACFEAWSEFRNPGAATSYLYPPPPDGRPRAHQETPPRPA